MRFVKGDIVRMLYEDKESMFILTGLTDGVPSLVEYNLNKVVRHVSESNLEYYPITREVLEMLRDSEIQKIEILNDYIRIMEKYGIDKSNTLKLNILRTLFNFRGDIDSKLEIVTDAIKIRDRIT